MAMLEYIVSGLHRPETIMPAVQELGRRHADYGVQEAHCATVSTALLWALHQELGPQCTPAVEAAWATAYTLLADTMQAATAESAYGAKAMQTATSAEGVNARKSMRTVGDHADDNASLHQEDAAIQEHTAERPRTAGPYPRYPAPLAAMPSCAA